MNPSILASGDGFLFTWRHAWGNADTYICRLDAEFRPVGQAKRLELSIPGVSTGTREDARLFRFKGKPYVSYTGACRVGVNVRASNCYARLNESTLTVEERWYPHAYGRGDFYEKNWSFYEHANQLYAIHTIQPHRILKIEGNTATAVYSTPLRTNYLGDLLRGGASPVLVGEEWYHWAHGYTWHGQRRLYNMSLVCFANKPPFRVTRMTVSPVAVADPATNQSKDYRSSFVVFPCGAMILEDQWCVAVGIHDSWSELQFFDRQEVERRLVRV